MGNFLLKRSVLFFPTLLSLRTAAAAKEKRALPSIISGVQRLTQRSVKFVRWLRSHLWSDHPLPHLHAKLTLLYATL